MKGTTHRAGAICMATTLMIINANTVPEIKIPYIGISSKAVGIAVALAGATLGGYLPDADKPQSHISNKLWFVLWPIWLIQGIISLLAALPGPLKKQLKLLKKISGHRGIAHTPIFWMVMMVLTFGSIQAVSEPFRESITMFFVYMYIGVGSHILLDTITAEGVPILFPFAIKRIRLTRIATGSIGEYLIFILTIIITFYETYSILS